MVANHRFYATMQYNVKGCFKQVGNKFGVKLSPDLEYHHEANGVAESKVKALKSLELLHSLVQRDDDWKNCLPDLELLFAYQALFQPTISALPFYLNHDRASKHFSPLNYIQIYIYNDNEFKIFNKLTNSCACTT